MKKFAVVLMLLMFAVAVLSGGCGGSSDDPVTTDEGQDPSNDSGRGNNGTSIQASDFKFTVIYKVGAETASATGVMDYTGTQETVALARADFYATVSNDDGSTYEFHAASEDLSAQAPARSYTMKREYTFTEATALYNQYNGKIRDPRVVMTFADGETLTIPLSNDNVAFEPASEESAKNAARASAIVTGSAGDPCCAFNNIGIPGVMCFFVPLFFMLPRKRR